MQAFKLKGKVDEAGELIIAEPVALTPGEVEIIILQASEVKNRTEVATKTPQSVDSSSNEYPIKALASWFADRPPADPDFDADKAKWQHLKEKHNL